MSISEFEAELRRKYRALYNLDRLTPELSRAIKEAVAKHNKRKARRKQTEDAIAELFRRFYRMSKSKWVQSYVSTKVKFDAKASAQCVVTKVRDPGLQWPGRGIKLWLTLRSNWLDRLLPISQAAGVIVLDAAEIEDGVWKAAWLEQSRGLKLNEVKGYLVRAGEKYARAETEQGALAKARRIEQKAAAAA
jgi:hypothetical protein